MLLFAEAMEAAGMVASQYFAVFLWMLCARIMLAMFMRQKLGNGWRFACVSEPSRMFQCLTTLLWAGFMIYLTINLLQGDFRARTILAVVMVAVSWVVHGLCWQAVRENTRWRKYFVWPIEGKAGEALADFGTILACLQIWFAVAILPALIMWVACQWFNDHLGKASFAACLGTAMLGEFLVFFFFNNAPQRFGDIVKPIVAAVRTNRR